MTAQDLLAQLLAKILSDTSAVRRTSQQHRLAIEQIPAGETEVAIRIDHVLFTNVGPDESFDANKIYAGVDVQVDMIHRLADIADEAAYRDATLLDDQAVLTHPTFWRELAAVFQVRELELLEPTERVGAVLTYTVGARVLLTP